MVNRRQLLKISALGTASFAAPLAYSASNITVGYNTGNATGSTYPSDMADNARNLDYLVNGEDASYLDRRGVPRKSWKGMEVEHNADQIRRKSEFDAFMNASGYEPPIPYAFGVLLDRTTKTVSYLGNEYRVRSSCIPLTTSTWAVDEEKLKLIGDDALRQNLAALADSYDSVNGADLSGWVRKRVANPIATVGGMLDALPVNIWEFAGLVVSKPNPKDTATWDWRPAVQAAIDAANTIYFPLGEYGLGGPVYLRDKTVLQGAGSAASRLRPLGDYDCVRVWVDYVGGTGISRAGLRDLMIYPQGNSKGTYTTGHAIHAKTSISSPAKVWKLMLDNVQVYQVGGTGLYLQGTSAASVAESMITNFEAKFCGENGIWENRYCFDTWLGQALLEDCKLFGARLQGGSATFLHMHTVACGQNDGFGNLTGGGFSIEGNYYDLINCHADRNCGHGYIIGGFGSEDLAQHNRLNDCISFNNGGTAGTKVGRNLHIGAVRDLKAIGGFFGNIGRSLLRNNAYGVDFVSPNTFQVDFIGSHFRGNQTQAVLFGAVVPAGEVTFNGCSFEGNVSITNNYAKAAWIACNGSVNHNIFNSQTWHGISSALSFDSTSATGISVDPLGEIKASRNGAAAAQFQRNGGNGAIQEFWRTNTKVGEVVVNAAGTQYGSASADWLQPPLKLGNYYLWVDSSGRLRIKDGEPTSGTDGTVVGAQE
jgi:hypothetical protein